MGFTVVSTKDGKNGRVTAKSEADKMSESELAAEAVFGVSSKTGESTVSGDAARLGVSREKARKADAARKDKSIEEYDAKRAKIEADVKSANYLNIKDKK